jgi:hypothetical protein
MTEAAPSKATETLVPQTVEVQKKLVTTPQPPDPKKLDEAANKINTEYEAILKADQNMKAMCDNNVNRAITVGDMLLTVKQAVGYGNWLPWLTTKCPNIPERTAQRWMNLAKKKEVLAERMKSATMADLTLKQAIDLCEDLEGEDADTDDGNAAGDGNDNDDSKKKRGKKPKEAKAPPPVRKRFTAAMEELVDLLPEFESIESAEEYADKARQRLDQTLASMRKEKEKEKEEEKAEQKAAA